MQHKKYKKITILSMSLFIFFLFGDTNCDGTINIVDALLIAQYYVGLINSFC